MTGQHTKGPWRIETRHGPLDVFGADRQFVCEVGFQLDNGDDEREAADARLIAAAPDMLDALKSLVAANEAWNREVAAIVGREPGWTDSYLDAARAAIAKAEGGAP
jgi:hypothetical protein